MAKISLKIAYPIIIAGLFIMVAFIALNYNSLSLNFYILLAFLVIYIFLFGFATGQNFSNPLKKLLESADNLSKGDLKSRFYLESKDELGELAMVFNRIAENLEESRSETDTMERSVDIKVQAKTQALEETINALEQKVKNRTLELEKIMGDLEKFKNDSKDREVEIAGLKNSLESSRSRKSAKKPKKEEEQVNQPST